MDTCIALRTAVVKDEVMYVQAGGGIVYDSDPEGEFQERCNKARALIRAAQEAVRFAAGTGNRNRSAVWSPGAPKVRRQEENRSRKPRQLARSAVREKGRQDVKHME